MKAALRDQRRQRAKRMREAGEQAARNLGLIIEIDKKKGRKVHILKRHGR